jgi:hypothetical protein
VRKARLGRGPPDAATILLAVVLLVATAAPARAVFRTETKFSADQHDDWEPHIAADDAGHLYWSTTRYSGRRACKSCPDPAIVYRVSDDNGISWSKPRFICRCPGVGGQHDPVFTTDDQGRVFAIWMNDFEVNFARSDDFGNTWTRHGPLDGILRYSDKPWIATSQDGEDVYVTFNANGHSPGAPYAVHSHNAGETFSPPVRTRPRNVRYWFSGGLAVTPGGAVFSAQDAYNQDYRGGILLYVQRSQDGGEHWTTIGIDRSREGRRCPRGYGCGLGYLGSQIAVASDDTGRVYVLWNANKRKGGPAALLIRWTDDDGESWSLPHFVDRAKARIDHQFPMIAATGSGDVRVGWMDDRTGRWNAWYRRSSDGGVTWSARVRLSNRSGGAPYKSAKGFRFPYGDYGGLAIDSEGNTHATWGEGPSYTCCGGSWYTGESSLSPRRNH